MRPILNVTLGLLAPALLLTAGCQRLNFEHAVKLEPGDVRGFPVDAPRGEQKVAVEVRAADAPVDVYVVLAEDENDPLNRLLSGRAPENVLASKKQVKETTLEATVPAKKKFSVLLANAPKTTSVALKIAGR